MKNEKFINGECYVFNSVIDPKINYGFIIINSEFLGKKKEEHITCVHVIIKKEGSIDITDFKNGYIYSYDVYNPIKLTPGVECACFDEESIPILKKMKHLGSLKVDQSKFCHGSGTLIREPYFSKMLSNLDLYYPNSNKIPLTNILEN